MYSATSAGYQQRQDMFYFSHAELPASKTAEKKLTRKCLP